MGVISCGGYQVDQGFLVYKRGGNYCKRRSSHAAQKNPPKPVHRGEASCRYPLHQPVHELISQHLEILECMDVLERYWVATQGLPVRKTAKVLGKGLSMIDAWVVQLEESGSANLAKCSTRPHSVCPREKRTRDLAALITRLRNKRFAWGRDKIKCYLRSRSWDVSEATIGHIHRRSPELRQDQTYHRRQTQGERRRGGGEAEEDKSEVEARAHCEEEA